MSEEIKKLGPLIWAEIERAKNILLHCHYNPDQDSVGSALALGLALENLGKRVTIIKGDSDLPDFAKYLPGDEKIVNRNYFEITPADFDLFLILDSSSLDRISKAGAIVFPAGMMTIVIDHHATNSHYGRINLVEATYPATAQILFDLFFLWSINLTSPIASNLLVGLHADTGGFKYRGTTNRTFEAAAALAKAAPDFDQILAQIDGQKSLAAIKFVGHILTNLEIHLAGQVAIGSMDYQTISRLGLTRAETHGTELAGILRDIAGVKLGFLLVEDEPGRTGISARSRAGDHYDVSALMKFFGGGGHQVAAGATVEKPLGAVKKELLERLTVMLK